MTRPLSQPHSPKHLRAYINVFVCLLILVGAATQWRHFIEAVNIVKHSQPLYVGLSLLLLVISFVAASLSYILLASSPKVRFERTVLIQVASGLTNRLFPVGLGGLGLYALYLHKQGLTIARSGAIVATNGSLGIVGNLLMLATVLLVLPVYFKDLHWPPLPPNAQYILIALAAILLMLIIILRAQFAKRLHTLLLQTWRSFKNTLRPSRHSGGALLCNMVLTACNTTILVFSAAAAGYELSWPYALLALSLGTILGAVVATPGGVGGVEAGQYAALIAYGMPPAHALAVVLLYRSVTYWLPIVPGIIALPYVRKHYL